MNNNSTNNSINGIRAKKISQLTSLPESFYPTDDNSNEDKLKNLYFVLGFNGENERISNYKMNFEELIDLLISTGKLSGSSSIHLITYNLEHITTTASNNFTGNTFELTLVPDAGYSLPEEFNTENSPNTIVGAASYIYNNETGYLYIIAAKGVSNISINALATPCEYTFDIDSTGITFEYESEAAYHINDTITINVQAIDEVNYDIIDRNEIGLEGLDIVSFNKNNDRASITVKINGSCVNTVLHISSKRIYYYYFGYSIKNDNILTYDDNGIPSGVGSNFETLFKGRNICPIPFEDGFPYGNGHDKIAENDYVFLVVPKKYYLVNRNLYIDDNNIGYSLIAGDSAFIIPVQTNPSTKSLMIYNNIIYKDIEYYIICISREGKRGRQLFRSEGNVGNTPLKIKWNTLLENKHIKEGATFDASSGNSITVYYLNGNEERKSSGYDIIIEGENSGTYENGIYTAPSNIEDSMSVTFVCKYIYNVNKPPLEDRISIIIEKTGLDEGLQGIQWNIDENIEIESRGTYVIDPTTMILGLYAGNESHIVDEPSLLQFEVINGVGELDGYTYIAPQTKNNLTAIIKATYKNDTEAELTITINGIGFDALYWPTDLPKSIYDEETLFIDKTLFKITDIENGISELIEDENNILLTSSLGTLTGNFFAPSTVNEDTEVIFTISYKGFTETKEIMVKHTNVTPSISGSYWYIGQYKPTGYTNPMNDLINILNEPNDKTGWREIGESFSYYKTNPLYEYTQNNKITFYDGSTYYVVMPEGFIFKDNLGETYTKEYEEINIGNKKYNVYTFETELEGNEETFEYNIYYTSSTPYYMYWGSNMPTIDTNPEDELSYIIPGSEQYGNSYTPGWYPIGRDVSIYALVNNQIVNVWESPTFEDSYTWLGEEFPVQYLILPKHTKASTKNTEFKQLPSITYKQDIIIQGKDYIIYDISQKPTEHVKNNLKFYLVYDYNE